MRYSLYISHYDLQKLSLENGLYMKNLDISRCERRRISGRRFSPHENTPAFAGYPQRKSFNNNTTTTNNKNIASISVANL